MRWTYRSGEYGANGTSRVTPAAGHHRRNTLQVRREHEWQAPRPIDERHVADALIHRRGDRPERHGVRCRDHRDAGAVHVGSLREITGAEREHRRRHAGALPHRGGVQCHIADLRIVRKLGWIVEREDDHVAELRRQPVDDGAVLLATVLEQHGGKAAARDVRRVEDQSGGDQAGAALEAHALLDVTSARMGIEGANARQRPAQRAQPRDFVRGSPARPHETAASDSATPIIVFVRRIARI